MEVKLFIAEHLKNETSVISSLDKEDNPQENTTIRQMYAEGWSLKTISPVPEKDPFRTYLLFEKEASF